MSMLKSYRFPQLNDPEWLRERIARQSVNAIAIELGAARTSVKAALQRYGLLESYATRSDALKAAATKATKKPTTYGSITRDDIYREYVNSDASLNSASKVLGCCAATLIRAMKVYGIERKSHGRHIPKFQKFPQLSNRDWLEKELKTKPMQQIAKELGTSSGNVSDHVKRHGLRHKHYNRTEAVKLGQRKNFADGRKGKDASNWKGGRVKTSGGYTYIYAPDHPYATKKGYIMEHRLIVEKELGRYLLPSEEVHHEFGNPGDNVPSKLEAMSRGEHIKRHYGAVKVVEVQAEQITALQSEIDALKAAQQRTSRKVERLIVDNQLRMFEDASSASDANALLSLDNHGEPEPRPGEELAL